MSSDDEQQQEPKINKRPFRPQSTLVQNFSADLDSIFGMTPELDNLSQTIEQKQRTLSTAEQELQALQARLRATEQKLAKVSRGNSPDRPDDIDTDVATNDQAQASAGAGHSTSPLSRRPLYPADRPPTAGQTPQEQDPQHREQNGGHGHGHGQNGEYVMVDRSQQ